MPFVIPAGNTANPFAWGEIMARQQQQEAAEGRGRSHEADMGLINAELGRQNTQTDADIRSRLLKEEYDLRARNDAATASSSSGGATLPSNPGGNGGLVPISPETYALLSLEDRLRYYPAIGQTNNRGTQMYQVLTDEEIASRRGQPTPGAASAAASIAANTNPVQNPSAPQGTAQPAPAVTSAPGEATLNYGGETFTVRPNGDGTRTIYNSQGVGIGTL